MNSFQKETIILYSLQLQGAFIYVYQINVCDRVIKLQFPERLLMNKQSTYIMHFTCAGNNNSNQLKRS